MSTVFLNGDYLPLESARISVLDRGFTFGDAVYEVIPVYNHQVFRLQEHLHRLHNSLSEIDITNPYSESQWRDIFTEILEKNNMEAECSLYLQVSRGVGERDHLDIDGLEATVFVMCREAPQMDSSAGVRAITHDDIRWDYCHIKATTLLASVLLKKHAKRANASEAILVKDGYITEGASSNVFVVRNGTVMTPGKDGSVLAGITRDLVVELLRYADIPCLEGKVKLETLQNADEVWLTSSTIGIAPVICVDDIDIANGKPGKIWARTNKLFQDFKNNPDMLN